MRVFEPIYASGCTKKKGRKRNREKPKRKRVKEFNKAFKPIFQERKIVKQIFLFY